MVRVLKTGGVAIVGVPNRHDPFLRPLLAAALQSLGLYAYGYEKSFSRRAFREMLTKAGLTVTAETAILFIPGWLRMLDLALYTRFRPASAITGLLVRPFAFLDRHLPFVRRHGYLLATVATKPATKQEGLPMTDESVRKTEQQWRETLTPEQYRVLRERGTEPAFTGLHWDNHAAGVYRCAGCGAELFSSDTKFDSGTGWPSFSSAAGPGSVTTHEDTSHGMRRIEVRCARCGGHLGHLFPDGPAPSGCRYCINSASLAFSEKKTRE
jgi:peptide-methionine (R)-S-oxide reductase